MMYSISILSQTYPIVKRNSPLAAQLNWLLTESDKNMLQATYSSQLFLSAVRSQLSILYPGSNKHRQTE